MHHQQNFNPRRQEEQEIEEKTTIHFQHKQIINARK